MTTAADIRADAVVDLKGQGHGQIISLAPAGTDAGSPQGTYDPSTGGFAPASGGAPTPTVSASGWGRVTRFSDDLAAGGLIQNNDRKIVWYPDDPTTKPEIDGIMTATNADGSTETYRVVALNARTLGGAVVCWIVQGRT